MAVGRVTGGSRPWSGLWTLADEPASTGSVTPMPDLEQDLLTLDDVATRLNVKRAQAYALVRRGDLRAVKIGGRGVWRVGAEDLTRFLEHAYDETSSWIEQHPFTEDEEPPPEE